MMRLLPYPLFSLFLLAIWLLLNGSLAPEHVILGGGLCIFGGLLLAKLQPSEGMVRRRPRALLVLLWLFALDIIRSNIAVARIAFHPRIRGRTSGFVSVPLELRHPVGLAALACIITATPGTSWARYDSLNNVLTIHILDLVDERGWVTQFKERYEQRLLEIFQ
jgi:multicomponent K+:H+ antiporter subunit E